MTIDLFEAMERLRKEFGASAYMAVYNHAHGISIRLSAIAGRQRHYYEIIISKLEAEKSKSDILELKFDEALELLKQQMMADALSG